MPPLDQRLLAHLEVVSGQRPWLKPEVASSLPLFLSERYQLQRTEIFGRMFLLALEKGASASAGEFEQHSNQLYHHLGEAAVLVLPALTQTARNRLVRRGVPFIVPGSQIFLPTAVMDLRARFPQPKPSAGKSLTPAAQCLLLYHLQCGSLEGVPLKQIAATIGYSPIMLTHVKDELEAAGLCQARRQGRAITLAFGKHGRELWDQARPLLSSPVQKQLPVHGQLPAGKMLFSGISALSRRTDLLEDRLPTYAMSAETFRTAQTQGLLQVGEDEIDATARVECWRYDPTLLTEGECVDPLSLYLSLSRSPDDRVQQQLQHLLEQIPW